MIRPYWVSEDRWPALGLLFVVVSLTLGMVYLSVLLNRWNNAFFSALQEKNAVAFRRQLLQVGWLVGAFIVLAVYQLYLNQMLEIRWRRWLTERYLRAWLTDRAYYRMQLVDGEADNPDQRIAEDVQLLISHTLALFIGGLRAVVTLGTFVAILWGLSGPLTVADRRAHPHPARLHGLGLDPVRDGGTWLTDWIGRPLVRLNFDQQRYEADFRFSLVRFRENTEGVALYRGEPDELRGFRERFEAVVRNWWGIMRQQKRLTCFTAGYAQAAWIFPSVVAAPRYFRRRARLGGLIQTAGAFSQVQDALSFFVVSYKDIASWRAVVERLAASSTPSSGCAAQPATATVSASRRRTRELTVEDVDLHLPDGQPLVANVDSLARRGDSVLLGGASGSGKSTLFRAIAGIWPFGHGEIRVPHERPHPLSPAEALPADRHAPRRRELSDAGPAGSTTPRCARRSRRWGLPELAGRLDESGHWALQLSPGEQQRIAFARALVQKPDWLFLDEATSAVDEATEARLYRLVRERLAGTTVFSVGHRATLRPFHARRLVLQPTGRSRLHRGGGGHARVRAARPARPPPVATRPGRVYPAGVWNSILQAVTIRRSRLRVYLDPTSTYQRHDSADDKGLPGFFCHLLVRNEGGAPARGCRGRLLDVSVRNPDGSTRPAPGFFAPCS